MKAPTKEELRAAYNSITTDGAQAPFTLELAALATFDPVLKGWIQRMAESHIANMNPSVSLIAEAMCTGALTYGLNLGLRVGEARNAKP